MFPRLFLMLIASFAKSLAKLPFLRLPFGPKFSIAQIEMTKPIQYTLSKRDQQLVNKINGFYGLIGPNILTGDVGSLFELFTGDGNIQGIFMENGNLTFVKRFVRTDKLVYESENGRIPMNMWGSMLSFVLNKFKLLPSMMDLANTALLNVNGSVYALYERDMPYLLNVDFQNKTIDTVRKIAVPSMRYFSAHSKYGSSLPINEDRCIETIEYFVYNQEVIYLQLYENFTIKNSTVVKTKYIPIVHDFVSTPDSVIITDSPIRYSSKSKIPVLFDNTKKTAIHVICKRDMTYNTYYSNESFYIFHYAHCKENERFIEIYASLYDDIDFNTLNTKANYRKIVIDKQQRSVHIIRNQELEKYDLDFPRRFGNKMVFININKNSSKLTDSVINGFIVCKDLNIKHKLLFDDLSICGEPSITYIDGKPYLLSFALDYPSRVCKYLLVINLRNYKIIKVRLDDTIPLQLGFHSLYIENMPHKKSRFGRVLGSLVSLRFIRDTFTRLYGGENMCGSGI